MKPTIFLFLQIFFQFQTIFIITYASKNSRSTLDLSLQQFSEDGAVQQVLYASKCVANSLPVFGFVDEDDNCAVIIAPFRRQNPLEIGKKRQRVEIFESAVGITTIGYPQDCSHIKNYANKIIQLHKFKYGEIMPLHGLANQLSSWLTRCMYPNPNNRKDNIARPIAVSTFICKYESNQLQSKLYLIENTAEARKYFESSNVNIAHTQNLLPSRCPNYINGDGASTARTLRGTRRASFTQWDIFPTPTIPYRILPKISFLRALHQEFFLHDSAHSERYIMLKTNLINPKLIRDVFLQQALFISNHTGTSSPA
eukprot:gene2375-4610_t